MLATMIYSPIHLAKKSPLFNKEANVYEIVCNVTYIVGELPIRCIIQWLDNYGTAKCL